MDFTPLQISGIWDIWDLEWLLHTRKAEQALILILVPDPFSQELLQHKAQKVQRTSKTKHRVQTPAALISPGNPSNAASQAALGRGFEQGRLWDAAGKCPVQREPFFVLLIF